MAARIGKCEECGEQGVSLRECVDAGGKHLFCVPCMTWWMQS